VGERRNGWVRSKIRNLFKKSEVRKGCNIFWW
jgi:hypothetical protein